MPVLNEDILHHVVTYISSEELQRINSCNPVFYEAWMKSRYRSLTFVKRDKEMKRLLQHLSDPNVAYHVKKIELRPWLVQPRDKTPQSKTENTIVKVLKVFDPHYTKKKADHRLQKRLGKDKHRVLTAFKQMHRLEEYSIDWDDTVGHHPEFFKAFLAPALENWSDQLVCLTVKVPPRMLDALARVRLSKLETFIYHFCTGHLSSKEIADTHDGFIVFVNNLKDSLESLTFASTYTSQELDISRVFRKLGHFPKLKKVTLSIPFDGGHLSNPMTFVHFLERHRSMLREINLSTSRCCVRNKPGDPEYINWIQRILGSIQTPFPQLQTLAVALRPLRAPLDVLIRFLNMHAGTISSLVLTERALNFAELANLFDDDLFAESLEMLQLKTDEFSAFFLSRIATMFPHLKTLKVECNRLVYHELRNRAGVPGLGNSEFSANLEDFAHSFAAVWGLQHLAVGPFDSAQELDFKQAMKKYLPQVHVTHFIS
ncbi:hypothetical protein D9613_010465 [Agrocybe pediades]|uniref:F-box domain-containing protein n=1 Tax=Agrocybe pediades TaxID=84607 RepID=A0A8H4QG50_9AGAR|nr:hypothetical protein D9613_010465 [Agrocybe pediades]